MKLQTWDTIEEFLLENEFEFTIVDSDIEIQNEIDEIQKENKKVIKILTDEKKRKKKGCRKWKPIKRRVCRFKNGKYKCVEVTKYICID